MSISLTFDADCNFGCLRGRERGEVLSRNLILGLQARHKGGADCGGVLTVVGLSKVSRGGWQQAASAVTEGRQAGWADLTIVTNNYLFDKKK
jgi:hypothetical protein